MNFVQVGKYFINLNNVAYTTKHTRTVYKRGDEVEEDGYLLVFNTKDECEALTLWLTLGGPDVAEFIRYLETHSYTC